MNSFRMAALGTAISLAALGYGLSAADEPKPHVRVQAPDLPLRAGAPYSQGVMASDLLYLSGNIGTDPATGKPPAAFADATRQSLANLEKVLKAAGLGWPDVVKVNVYVKDMARYDEFNSVYTSVLPAPLPARTFLGVLDLPGGGQVEIEAVAVRRSPR
ncbi:MAG TPA: Rid family detoxifying hydrolase [Vicinamibacteria bacterium]|nr:Rid family detoxifying hydrolase [Vicinamibacteria bacterium]